ncbi:MAG TPA: DNA cytosine methyltransferase [Holophagaceae bacterium]|nr:DNA cytosine methyltransferase [Holophagaceae bacterium]
MKVLELFSGIGGWRYAMEGIGEVVAAYDISPAANATYTLNHGHAPLAKELAHLPLEKLAAHGADTWALSPPCQPYCRMGKQQDLEDPRSRAFLHLLRALEAAPPGRLILENVEGFEGSQAHLRLSELLRHLGMHERVLRLCPSEMGIPNLRPRLFLLASTRPIPDASLPAVAPCPLEPYLDVVEDEVLFLPEEVLAKHLPGLDLAAPEDRRSACFIGGYGRRLVGSGSFLRTSRGLRRFSPAEIALLMGLPAGFRFPEMVPLEKRYKLLGNGLSIPAARFAFSLLAG